MPNKITEMDVREFTKRQNMRDKYGREGGKKRKKHKSPRILFVSIVAGITYKTVGYDHKVINTMHKHEWLYSLRHNPYKDSPQKSKSAISHELFGHFVLFGGCKFSSNLLRVFTMYI